MNWTHRAVGSAEHNPSVSLLHGYCRTCVTPWPCDAQKEADRIALAPPPPIAARGVTEAEYEAAIMRCGNAEKERGLWLTRARNFEQERDAARSENAALREKLAAAEKERDDIRDGPNGQREMARTISRVWAELPARDQGEYIWDCVRKLRVECEALRSAPAASAPSISERNAAGMSDESLAPWPMTDDERDAIQLYVAFAKGQPFMRWWAMLSDGERRQWYAVLAKARALLAQRREISGEELCKAFGFPWTPGAPYYPAVMLDPDNCNRAATALSGRRGT